MSLILYPKNEKLFDSNGIGILSDAIDAEVYEVLNGQYELTVQYPIDGIHFAEIVKNAIITSPVDPVSDPQPFEIYRITKPMKGVVTIYARHVAYKLRKIAVSPFSAESASAALQGLKNNAVNECPFEYWTDKSTAGNFTVKVPTAAWTLMGNSEGSILDTYGGEYEFDKWTVKLHNRRGADRGVSIRYGKNLTSLEQDENCANVCTGVYPYWADMDGNVVMLPEKVVMIADEYEDELIMPLDLSQAFETAPTEEQLRAKTESYIKANDIGKPDVSWTVEFVQLEQTEEYKGKALLERVLLGDTVSVVFPKLGVDVSARAVAARYKPLLGRYKNITLGKVRANIADTIVQQGQNIEKKPSVSLMQSIIMTLTASILGARGGAVRLLDTDGDGMPDTLYVADNADPALALKVWRWNYEGWAGSKTGYNGPFTIGATLEDGLLAEAVTAANLVAGTIKSKDGKTFFLDLDNGILKMQATELSISGKTVDQIAQEKLDTYAAEVTKDIEALQAQIDGNITSWFGDYVPTASNEPASNWTTEDLKNQHLGDLFYINEGAEQGGMVYRWALANGSYQWVIVEDTDVAKALAAAAAAQDTADSKRRVFVVQPTPPYDVGDLWAQGGSGDLMRCNTARASGSYVASDWGLASKYIDSAQAGSIAQGTVDAQTQQDIFNKLTNNGAAHGVFMKDGQIYINAAYLATGIISSADGTVQIDLNNNTVTVQTLNGSTPGKLVLSADGLQGWGWDYATNNYVRTLILQAGDNGATVDGTTYPDTYTSFTTWQGAAGLNIAPGLPTAVLSLGQPSAKTIIRGSEIALNGEIIGPLISSIEESNGFTCIKYSNGLAEGWGTKEFSGVNVYNGWGQLVSSGALSIPLPAAVTAVPERCELSLLETNTGVFMDVSGKPTQTSTQDFYLISALVKTATVKVGYRVVWRWK